MLSGGWPEEVRGLLDAGYGPELPSFSAVGYREVAAYVRGEMTLDETAERVKTATHRLIRRQATWFKATDERIAWSPDAASLAIPVIPAKTGIQHPGPPFPVIPAKAGIQHPGPPFPVIPAKAGIQRPRT